MQSHLVRVRVRVRGRVRANPNSNLRAVAPCVVVLDLPARACPTRAVDTAIRPGIARRAVVVHRLAVVAHTGLRRLVRVRVRVRGRGRGKG